MLSAEFRFYDSLNYFLPAQKRQMSFRHRIKEQGSVKDVIESLGVPHPEVDLILVNGEPVDFSYLVQDGDQISVYPSFTCLDLGPVPPLRPPLTAVRFLLDIHLGKLANYLRLLGFDTHYGNDYHDEELAAMASKEERILLTRDRGLLKRRLVTYGYCVRQDQPEKQVLEILERFRLQDQIRPFQRCMHCNGSIKPVAKSAIEERLQPKTRLYYEQFSICQECDRIYWSGSHYEKMQGFIEEIIAQISPPQPQIDHL